MKTFEIKTFDYNELDDTAKQTAFERWQKTEQRALDDYYPYQSEVDNLLDFIEKKSGVSLKNYSCDFNSCEFEVKFQPLFSDSDYNEERLPLRGYRAAKAALSIYYDLCERKQRFGEVKHYFQDGKKYRYLETNHEGLFIKSRPSAIKKLETCPTGYYLGEVFTAALLDSIKTKTARHTSLNQHLSAAFNALWESVIEDYDYQISKERFDDLVNDNEFVFLEDGTDFNLTAYAV